MRVESKGGSTKYWLSGDEFKYTSHFSDFEKHWKPCVTCIYSCVTLSWLSHKIDLKCGLWFLWWQNMNTLQMFDFPWQWLTFHLWNCHPKWKQNSSVCFDFIYFNMSLKVWQINDLHMLLLGVLKQVWRHRGSMTYRGWLVPVWGNSASDSTDSREAEHKADCRSTQSCFEEL